MAGQMRITSFFAGKNSAGNGTSGVKRGSAANNGQNLEPSPKLQKTESGSGSILNHLKVMENSNLRELIDNQCKLTPVLHPNIGATWYRALETEFTKPYFAKLSEFVTKERKNGTVYPKPEDVYSWTHHTPINGVKVVILGQDPYHNPGQAHGLCFSVPPGISSPPSLINMYKELEIDIPGFVRPTHGNLTGWAKQGVLLLNASLTVKAHCANSHKDRGWEEFTNAVVKYISDNLDGVVFMLWGSYAKKKGSSVNKKKHLILSCAHPSPLSAYNGFFGCKHFSQANKYLQERKKRPIDWGNLPSN